MSEENKVINRMTDDFKYKAKAKASENLIGEVVKLDGDVLTVKAVASGEEVKVRLSPADEVNNEKSEYKRPEFADMQAKKRLAVGSQIMLEQVNKGKDGVMVARWASSMGKPSQVTVLNGLTTKARYSNVDGKDIVRIDSTNEDLLKLTAPIESNDKDSLLEQIRAKFEETNEVLQNIDGIKGKQGILPHIVLTIATEKGAKAFGFTAAGVDESGEKFGYNIDATMKRLADDEAIAELAKLAAVEGNTLTSTSWFTMGAGPETAKAYAKTINALGAKNLDNKRPSFEILNIRNIPAKKDMTDEQKADPANYNIIVEPRVRENVSMAFMSQREDDAGERVDCVAYAVKVAYDGVQKVSKTVVQATRGMAAEAGVKMAEVANADSKADEANQSQPESSDGIDNSALDDDVDMDAVVGGMGMDG